MKCQTEIDIERLEANMPLKGSEIVQVELNLSACAQTWKKCNNALNRRLIADKLKKDAIDDPTTQECDESKGWFKKLLGLA